MEKLQELAARLKEKFSSTTLVLVLGLVGMGLILLSEFLPENTGVTQSNPTAQTSAADSAVQSIADTQTYQAALEAQLANLLSQIDGVGQASVMITLAASEEIVYATDTQTSSDSAVKEHVLLDDGTALSEKTLYPEVVGVAVVCEGGDSASVEIKITNLVCALFNVSSNHISVEKMN